MSINYQEAQSHGPDVLTRAQELFQIRVGFEHRTTDRIFIVLLMFQWTAAVVIALTLSPRTWAGTFSQTHIHVWAAILLGGVITALPVAMGLVLPGKPLTRHVIAAAQMFWSALLIHLCGGRIETHFHVFVSLAFLASYRDWRILITATVIITADHLMRGLFWPQSVYGVLTASPLRVMEHAGWVLFEDAILLISLRSSVEESRKLALQQAVLEQNHQRIEAEVEKRTQQLRAKEEEVIHLQRLEAVGQLAGGIAHEFNNLLQAIRGYVNLAIQGMQPHQACHQDLQQVLKAADRATILTRGLLGFGRRREMQSSVIAPNELLKDLLLMIKPLIGETVILDVNLEEPLANVRGDSALLQQMLMNLCVNARDAMSDGGRLSISTRNVTLTENYCAIHAVASPGDYILLTVSDSGCGMSPEVRQQIFEPFFTTKEVGKGTGLGLAMVHGVVQQHSGWIYVYSEPGRGTTFKIYLPSVQAAVEEETTRCAVAISGGTETILIAEDESIVRALTERLLTQAGYRVITAVDGQHAVELFQVHENELSLVLLDVVMPKLNGRNALQRMRESRPNIPAILCSGYDPHLAQEMLSDVKLVSLLEKPYDPHDLLRAVRNELDRVAEEASENERVSDERTIGAVDTSIEIGSAFATSIDREALVARCMGNVGFALSLLEDFERTVQQRVDEIAQSASARLSVELEEAAHALKGAAGILAAEPLRKLAAKIEEAGRSSEFGAIDALIEALRTEVVLCLNYVQRLRTESVNSSKNQEHFRPES
jgi:signal transduction histidine kinase/CheY-like chemotaxis protein/HPt (histidine-containing phosphotransfer) domain-containing protein